MALDVQPVMSDMRMFKKGLRPETTSEDIFSACRDGDEFYCKEWSLSAENDLNITDQHGFSPLHYACVHGHSGIVEHFLLRGARTDILNMGGDSLIHVAAQFGKYDVVMKILKTQPDVNLPNEHGNTPLHYAAFWNFIGICEVLVKQGALIAIANKHGETPLSKARPRLRKKLESMAEEFGQSLLIVPHKKTKAPRKNEYMEFKQRQPEVEQSQVTMSLKIGSGYHGETWKGSWSGHTVVVKKLKTIDSVITASQMENFHREYTRLRIFNCDSILPLLAVITEPQLHTISMFMQLGSLYHVLHDLDSEVKINLVEGVQFARGICQGMAYLHNMDPLIAGFNLNPYCVLIDDDMTAKLDMAHTRFSFMDSQKVFRPNWIAPELLGHRPEEVDRRACDMYSFAIILWEIATGKIPFLGLSPMQVGIKVVKENSRPLLPNHINHHLQRIIDICWNADPHKRPRFEKIKPILEKLEVS